MYSITEISEILHSEVVNKSTSRIRYLLTDSRSIISASESLFFALIGARHNGHKFIRELYDQQVRNFVVSVLPDDLEYYKDASFIKVPDTLKALQHLASWHRKKFSFPVIGITGSNGKTIIKEWLFQLLREDYNIVRSPKSYNSQVGVPLSVWQLDKDHDLAIFEAGISLPGEMQNLQPVILPDIGIISNIGDAHQQNFMDYKHKTREKLMLFSQAKTLIYCKDHNTIESQIRSQKQLEDIRLFSWSRKSTADLFISKTAKNGGFTVIDAVYKNKHAVIRIPFIDDASVENAIHCWSLMLVLNISQEVISRRMELLAPVAMRLELRHGINNCTIINDSYNSDLGSLGIALDVLNQQNQHLKKTLIISDILQSGRDEEMLYKEVADLVDKKDISKVIGIGEAISRNAGLFRGDCHFYSSTGQFIKNIVTEKFSDEAILLKGSRSFEFELISNMLQSQAHRTVLEINLNAIVHNLNYYRSCLNQGTKIMVMVKAFSYGSGSYEIANLLQFHRVDYLGVAFTDEGVTLRNAGITLPILVMNAEVQDFDTMIEHNLEPEIFSFRILRSFSKAVQHNMIHTFAIHIKLDTGMKRLGFTESEMSDLAKELKTMDNLRIRSVFSHLAASDESIHDEFSRQQIQKFEAMSSRITEMYDYQILRHILNSSGIERFPEAQYDMVRLGIGLYGLSSLSGKQLANVTTLKSNISQVKNVKSDETVGYNRMGKTGRDSRIAIVPVGYSDGLNRRLGNGTGKILVKGQFAPIIGNICMDMCMIDITGIDADEGDEVIIFGDSYPLTGIARLLDTIPYEIMTGISARVKRVYFQE
ncbi:MAG: bifunctional UDP-N-acetylmuramoyl-tripeptide:D-alanyl-D-alanine ligase/alanine racemase [Bacteroidia bacterium]|nr:bifunctional UDP-N-acetylmuramoyl-tripeptide:D-alanyl-D-alanine ligase/alanine racemase [Bacteroidia bacterium]